MAVDKTESDEPGGGSASRQLARSGSISFVGAAISALMGFVFTLVLARAFGETGAGIVFQTIAIFSIAMSLTKLGMDSVAVWLLPRLQRSARDRIRGALAFMAVLVLGASVLGSVALMAMRPLLTEGSAAPEDLHAALTVAAWFLPAGSLMLFALSATRGLGGVLPYVLVGNIAVPSVRPIAILGVWALGGTSVIAVAAWAASLPFGLLVAWLVVRGLVRTASRQNPGSRWAGAEDRKAILRYSGPRTLSAGLDQSILWLDVVLVGILAGTAAAGVYGGVSRLVAAGLIVDVAIRVVVSPRFSALLHEGRLREVQELYRIAAMWLVFLSTPIYIILGVFAPTVLGWLGPGFVEGAPALAVLGLGAVITLMAGNIHSVLLMGGYSGWAALNKVVVLTINVLGNILLVPVIGIMGAALSWAASMLIDAVLASVQVRILIGVRVEVLAVLRALAGPVVGVGVPSAFFWWWLGGDSLLAMCATIIAGGALLAVWAWVDRRHLQLADLGSLRPQR